LLSLFAEILRIEALAALLVALSPRLLRALGARVPIVIAGAGGRDARSAQG
jgi:hypothetical protein